MSCEFKLGQSGITHETDPGKVPAFEDCADLGLIDRLDGEAIFQARRVGIEVAQSVGSFGEDQNEAIGAIGVRRRSEILTVLFDAQSVVKQ